MIEAVRAPVFAGDRPHGDDTAVALGRKTWLQAGSGQGGDRAAGFLSLVETAEINGLDPKRDPGDPPTRIADHPIDRIADLLYWTLRPC
ncbi:MAG: transposase domain-containing protein [Rhodospirillaceae bacterium]|nr:transposase domain-containing protein [Rhodospirillaceae bacterium]